MGSFLEGSFERTLSVNDRVNLEVATRSGVIRIVAGPAGAVHVRGLLRGKPSRFGLGNVEERIRRLEANPPIEQYGNAVRFEFLEEAWLGSVTMLLEITAPPNTTVHARTVSGDIRVQGVEGPAGCRTDSGQIAISDVVLGVRAEADSGPIRIERVQGPVYAEADSGEIHALEIGGPIEARTDSGEMQLSLTVAAPVRAKADSGSIRLRLASGCGYQLRVRTDSGSIHTPEMLRRDNSENEVEGRIGAGGPLVDLEADSGSITVE